MFCCLSSELALFSTIRTTSLMVGSGLEGGTTCDARWGGCSSTREGISFCGEEIEEDEAITGSETMTESEAA